MGINVSLDKEAFPFCLKEAMLYLLFKKSYLIQQLDMLLITFAERKIERVQPGPAPP